MRRRRSPAVGFDLRLALAAGRRAAAVLAGEVGPGAGQPRQRISGAGELDLKHGLAGRSAFGEDIEDDLFAVDDAAMGQPLPVALLRRSERIVENQAVGLALLQQLRDFPRLAGTDAILRHGGVEIDDNRFERNDIEIPDQIGQFIEMFFHLGRSLIRSADADEQSAFDLLSGVFCHIDHMRTNSF